ncbi:C3HC zinc finger-like-domain-containing protein [Gloeopeniophorella convolvens]|nr:C3HC zinc finger-like-domain-containing protein [Gloeopeniophorella convolvens]
MQADSSTPGPSQTTPGASTSMSGANKRKLDDALQTLDEAMSPHTFGERPAKRPHLVHSLYSTLAKYGIKSKEPAPADPIPRITPDLSKAPHLAAILARTAAKARAALPARARARPAPPLASGATAAHEYRPSSTESLLERLVTYRLGTYANKPRAIDALAAARCGWVNDGKDRLVCGLCRAAWVLAGRDGMGREAANALVEKQRVQLVEMHKDGCPWKKRQCDADVYRIQLASPAGMAKEIKARAFTLESVLEGVEVKHPLSSTQTQALLAVITSVEADSSLDEGQPEDTTEEAPSSHRQSSSLQPSSAAVLTALFGWSLAPPTLSSFPSGTSTPARSRASSVAPREGSVGPSVPQTPRRLSGFGGSGIRLSTPTPFRSLSVASIPGSPRSSVAPEQRKDTALLHCSLCHRRLGLWAAGAAPRGRPAPGDESGSLAAPKPRQIDLLKEHRPYCPYVARSTVVPSLPASPASPTHMRATSSTPSLSSVFSSSSNSQSDAQHSNAVEGWRAVLLVVLRYRLGQWQRRRVSRNTLSERVEGEPEPQASQQADTAPPETHELDESWVEVDPVEAMVEGVKSKGGSELLKYVKGLLG